MRIKSMYLLLGILLMGAVVLFRPAPLFALDPSEEHSSCFNNEEGTSSKGRPCSVVNCEWRNLENVFSGKNDTKEVCANAGTENEGTNNSSTNEEESQVTPNPWIAGSMVAAIFAGLGLFVYAITKKNKRKK